MTRIADVIEAGQKQGAFRADICPNDVSVLFVQTTQGMLLMTKCQKSVETLARGARLLVELISNDCE
jgi:hypothetical protein